MLGLGFNADLEALILRFNAELVAFHADLEALMLI